ncbi:MAG: TRAP transporter substrate-binding protein [Betaproteobacteria bacterium]|jgi:TRAP-type C4-dicarboxylate transport system substrate-binding protein|nr:TRAP transporter substrate-binding protein [Betaproteobacteria bacterium]
MFSKPLIASAVAAAGFLAAAPAAAQTTLTLSSWVPPQHLITRAMMEWAGEVEKASNGRIKHTLVPKAVAKPPGTFDAVRDGLADVSFSVDGYTPGRFVLTRIAEFPQLGETATTVSVAYERISRRYFAKADEHKGVRVLTVFTHGPGEIYNTKRPINTLADLKGLKIRVGGGMINELAKSLGVDALLKPAPQSYEILSTGVADGVFFPAESVASFKLEKLIKYATLVPGGLYNTSFAFIMNPDKYNKMSAADKKVIDDWSGEKLARLIGKHWDRGDQIGREALKTNNVPTITADAAFISALNTKIGPLEDAWYKLAAEKGVDGKKVLAEFRAEIKKVEAGN